jgi:DnaJ-class molecular chaperone
MPNPFYVLGVRDSASDAEVRSAYMAKLREFPPEREPERFQMISDAYAAIRTAEDRARQRVFGQVDEKTELTELVPDDEDRRERIGQSLWLKGRREVARG